MQVLLDITFLFVFLDLSLERLSADDVANSNCLFPLTRKPICLSMALNHPVLDRK